MRKQNTYSQIIEDIFLRRFSKGVTEVPFSRDDIVSVARKLGVSLPKNLGDVIYSFRYRASLPEAIRKAAPRGFEWIIRPAGQGRYKFVVAKFSTIHPTDSIAETKIPDATPGIIEKYALSDEQALLAKLRYNRLIDVFTGIVCYSLQSHLRTSIRGMGQVETDEVYVGIDKRGVHYVIPVQAKGSSDRMGIVQIEQDIALCKGKFPDLVCRAIGAQFMSQDLIALIEFESSGGGVAIVSEKHYRLVPTESIEHQDLVDYKKRPLPDG